MTSESTDSSSTPHTARPWVAWQDWLNVLLAAYLFVSPLIIAGLPNGRTTNAWFMTLGVLIFAVAVWALKTSSSTASESIQIFLGVVLFLSPWLGGFAAVTLDAWTAWIIGIAVIVLAVAGMTMRRPMTTRPTTA